MCHLNEVNRIIDDNKIQDISINTDIIEKVRDECADLLKEMAVDR
jgi:hypothetical protein